MSGLGFLGLLGLLGFIGLRVFRAFRAFRVFRVFRLRVRQLPFASQVASVFLCAALRKMLLLQWSWQTPALNRVKC